VAHFVWQIDAFHHACTAYLRVAQSQNVHGPHIRPSWSSLLYDIKRIFAGLRNHESVAERYTKIFRSVKGSSWCAKGVLKGR
jgi:hypothetical protein